MGRCDYCQEKFEDKQLEKCDTCGECYCSDCVDAHRKDKDHYCKEEVN